MMNIQADQTLRVPLEGPQPAALERPLPPLTPNASLRWDVVSRLLPERVGNALEIGCGRGAAAARIARRAETTTAVEPDAQSFHAAQQNLRGLAQVFNCMSYELPLTERFDTICAFEVLEHIEDDAVALAEWRERLVPGGRLVLSVPAYQSRYGAADEMVGHFRRYDPDRLEYLLAQAGFVDAKLQLYGFLSGHALETFRNLAAARRRHNADQQPAMAELTAGSGRLMQPDRGLSGALAAAIAKPLSLISRMFPNRGVGLVATARTAS